MFKKYILVYNNYYIITFLKHVVYNILFFLYKSFFSNWNIPHVKINCVIF